VNANWVQAITVAVVLAAFGYAGWCDTRRRRKRETTGMQRLERDLIAGIEAMLARRAEFEAWDRDRQDGQP
jgi:hypothetical protein